MNITRKEDGSYKHGNTRYSLKQVVNLYKEKKVEKIVDEYDNDVTAEALTEFVFGAAPPIEFVARIIDPDELEDMVYCGGYDNWKLRRRIV